MEIKDLNQAMALQKELSTLLQSNIEKLRDRKTVPVSRTLDEQKRLVSQAEAELAASKQEKARYIERLDLKIQQRTQAVERLQSGLDVIKKKIKEVDKSVKKAADSKTRKKR